MHLTVKLPAKLTSSLLEKQNGLSLSSLVVKLLKEYDCKCAENVNVGDTDTDGATALHHKKNEV